ncbi:MAG: transglycosylase SLT domain-containing protein [Oligoflexia bacterium]|nr:transglycosylase SLT domain-containing protein [Oligoflexia bacterium]
MRRIRMFSLVMFSVLAAGCAHSVKPAPLVHLDKSLALPFQPEPGPALTKSTAPAEPKVESRLLEKLTPPVAIKKIAIPKAKSIPDPLAVEGPLLFDIPVSYNARVAYWIEFFQSSGRNWFMKWLERSSRYMPSIKRTLRQHGLPQDLAYMAMIESGFSAHARSHANAVGPWQFISETGKRYGLRINWWIDERKDFEKSTVAAAKYLKRMYSMFNNWYLVAAGYNTGENRIKRLIEKHGTRNFWKIARQSGLEDETRDYVPKMIAAMLIAKSPQMYGFNSIEYYKPLSFEHFRVPGGTRLDELAEHIGVTEQYLQDLNPELLHGYIPPDIDGHLIRIPKGSYRSVSQFVRRNLVSDG